MPTYGFGANVNFPNFPNRGSVSHYFPCSGSFERDHGYSIEGVFEQYVHCMKHITLSGPTYFAPLIKEVVEQTRDKYSKDAYSYTVLLIITDGDIHDMQKTKDWIVEGSELPLSIIIVGVGQASFTSMEELDSDDKVGQASP